MKLDEKLENIFNEYLSSPSEKILIEPFFDTNRIKYISDNITFEKGKPFILKKENIWNPELIHNKRGILLSNCYFQIRKLKNTYILLNRFQDDFKMIYGINKSVDRTYTVIWTSDDGLHFDSNNRYLLTEKHIDNHNTFINCEQCGEKKKIMLFRGRGYGLKRTDEEGFFKFDKTTGLKLEFFQPDLQTFSERNVLVSPNHMPKHKTWAGDQFDSLNSINYHSGKYFVHARVNRIDSCTSIQAHRNNKSQNKYFYRNRGVKLLIYDETFQYITTYKNHKESYCKYYLFHDFKSKEDLQEMNLVDIYVSNVTNYTNSLYNLANPVGLDATKYDWERNFFNIGLFFTPKKDQLNFFRLVKNKEVIAELKPKDYYFVNGMVESKEKTHYNFYIVKGNQIDCYQIQKDRIRCIQAKDDEGYVIMKAKANYKNLNINFETYEDGFVFCQLLEKNTTTVIGESVKMKGDFINYHVDFLPKKGGKSINLLFDYDLKIILKNSSLFSYTLT